MAIFLHFSPTSSHLYSLQVKNCASNSRLVVDKDDLVNSGLKGLNDHFVPKIDVMQQFTTTNSGYTDLMMWLSFSR